MSSMKEIPCGSCGKLLKRFPSGLKGKRFGIFCDRTCLGKFRSKYFNGSDSIKFRGFAFDRKYVMVHAPWHPNRNDKNRYALHRLIAEVKLGRFLEPGEIVHHKDHNPENNHWTNLEVMTQSEHFKQHLKEMKNAS